MTFNKKQIATRIGAALLGLALPAMTLAQSAASPFATGGAARNYVTSIGGKAGISTTQTLPQIIGTIINVLLGFMGIFLLVYIMYAGFLWMTADGKETEVKEAQTRIKNAIIGLIIILSSFAISNFVMDRLVNITNGTTT